MLTVGSLLTLRKRIGEGFEEAPGSGSLAQRFHHIFHLASSSGEYEKVSQVMGFFCCCLTIKDTFSLNLISPFRVCTIITCPCVWETPTFRMSVRLWTGSPSQTGWTGKFCTARTSRWWDTCPSCLSHSTSCLPTHTCLESPIHTASTRY